MRDGNWGQGRVRQAGFTAAGLLSKASGFDVTRELPSALPGQASAVGGLTQATGSVTITGATGQVNERVGTPFNRRDWPQSGDPVAVEVTDGTNRHRVFTGNVDGTDSSFGSPDVSVGLVDHTDRLSTQVSANAVFRTMPPLSTVGDERPRMTGLTSAWVTSALARGAGYNMVPPMGGFTVISAPLTGSTWAERGDLWESGRHTDIGNFQRYQPGVSNIDGSVYMDALYATYKAGPDTPYTGAIAPGRPLTLSMGAGPVQRTSSYVSARWPLGTEARMAVTSARDIIFQKIGTDGAAEEVVRIRGNDARGWEFATAKVEQDGNWADITLETDTGVKATGTVVGPTEWWRGQFNYVRVYAPDGCPVNGVQASFTSSAHPATSFKANFTAEIDYVSSLEVMPALVSEPAGGLLNSQAEAECAALWLDEDGALHWHGRRKLMEQPAAATLTSSQIADAKITMDAQDVRSKVSVKYQAWATSVAVRSRLIVYEGQKDELEVGDFLSTIINPPSDEQWVQVDSTPRAIYGGENTTRFNAGFGSFHGYTVLTSDGDEFSTTDYDESALKFERIGPDSWKASLALNGLPSTADRVKTATRSDEGSSLKASYRDRGLPLLRAMGKATSTDAEYVSTVRGPSWAPELVHDVGWFIQQDTRIKGVADFIATELAQPKPRITGLDVLPDPRTQLGDMIRLRETARTGLELAGVVTGITQAVGPGEHSMSLELMVKSVVANSVTFSEFDAWYEGKTIAQVDAVFNGDTFAQHDATPLRQ